MVHDAVRELAQTPGVWESMAVSLSFSPCFIRSISKSFHLTLLTRPNYAHRRSDTGRSSAS
jgi:hypothetical protein